MLKILGVLPDDPEECPCTSSPKARRGDPFPRIVWSPAGERLASQRTHALQRAYGDCVPRRPTPVPPPPRYKALLSYESRGSLRDTSAVSKSSSRPRTSRFTAILLRPARARPCLFSLRGDARPCVIGRPIAQHLCGGRPARPTRLSTRSRAMRNFLILHVYLARRAQRLASDENHTRTQAGSPRV